MTLQQSYYNLKSFNFLEINFYALEISNEEFGDDSLFIQLNKSMSIQIIFF